MYEIKAKDLYSQNGEGFLLEYVLHHVEAGCWGKSFIDVGAGDGFILSNTRHLRNIGYKGPTLDKNTGQFVTCESILNWYDGAALISIDIDGNDFWVLDTMLNKAKPFVIIAEFNSAFTDSRTIKYNPNHVWAGDDYYGFTFEAGKKLADKYGYEIIFNVANMNLIMVDIGLIEVSVPPVTYEHIESFEKSNRNDWVWI